jgi:hypothetical protein
MLRAEQGDEIDPGRTQPFNGMDPCAIDAALVGDQPHAPAAHQVKAVAEQDFEARLNSGAGPGNGRGRCSRSAGTGEARQIPGFRSKTKKRKYFDLLGFDNS